jgi:hypothetical protein
VPNVFVSTYYLSAHPLSSANLVDSCRSETYRRFPLAVFFSVFTRAYTSPQAMTLSKLSTRMDALLDSLARKRLFSRTTPTLSKP